MKETFREWQDVSWEECECCKDIYGNGKAAWTHQQKKIDELEKKYDELVQYREEPRQEVIRLQNANLELHRDMKKLQEKIKMLIKNYRNTN